MQDLFNPDQENVRKLSFFPNQHLQIQLRKPHIKAQGSINKETVSKLLEKRNEKDKISRNKTYKEQFDEINRLIALKEEAIAEVKTSIDVYLMKIETESKAQISFLSPKRSIKKANGLFVTKNTIIMKNESTVQVNI